jgi:redox-sensing transcriptional repressor
VVVQLTGNKRISERSLERLSLYRRALLLRTSGTGDSVYSHQIAAACGVSAAQVRRDLMAVGYSGTPTAGYDVARLLESLSAFLDTQDPTSVAIVGVGDLGRAVINFLAHRRPKLHLVAAFDADPDKTKRVVHGIRCHAMADLCDVITEHAVQVAILAVPAAAAQEVADQVVACGVKGILSFAPTFLRLPPGVVVERVDMTVALEKVAFLACKSVRAKRTHR